MSARAQRLAQLHADLHDAFERRATSTAHRAAWFRAADRFNEARDAFYAPYPAVVAGIRAGRRDAMEEGLLFLAADPWCFRSGYLKADLMGGFANTDVPADLAGTLEDVVVRRVIAPEPRLLRYAARLASNIWSDELARRLEVLAGDRDEGVADRARTLVEWAEHRTRSLAGRHGTQ